MGTPFHGGFASGRCLGLGISLKCLYRRRSGDTGMSLKCAFVVGLIEWKSGNYGGR